jgi:hypothetical protein
MPVKRLHTTTLAIEGLGVNFKEGAGEQASRNLSCEEIAWRAPAVVIVGAVAATFPGPE